MTIEELNPPTEPITNKETVDEIDYDALMKEFESDVEILDMLPTLASFFFFNKLF